MFTLYVISAFIAVTQFPKNITMIIPDWIQRDSETNKKKATRKKRNFMPVRIRSHNFSSLFVRCCCCCFFSFFFVDEHFCFFFVGAHVKCLKSKFSFYSIVQIARHKSGDVPCWAMPGHSTRVHNWIKTKHCLFALFSIHVSTWLQIQFIKCTILQFSLVLR